MEVDDDNLGLVITDVRSLQPDEANLRLVSYSKIDGFKSFFLSLP